MFFNVRPIVKGLFKNTGGEKFMSIGRNSVKPRM